MTVAGLRLGDIAPDFPAVTSAGDLGSFHAWKQGRWTILFSHPDDLTPVCTTGSFFNKQQSD